MWHIFTIFTNKSGRQVNPRMQSFTLFYYLTFFLLISILCIIVFVIYFLNKHFNKKGIEKEKETFANAATLNADNTTYTLYYIASHNGRYLFDAKKLDAPKFVHATRGIQNLNVMMNNKFYALKSVSIERERESRSGEEFLDIQLDTSNQSVQTLTLSSPSSSHSQMTDKTVIQIVVFS